MTDENDLVVRILREIQATQAEHTKTLAEHTAHLASIRETLRLHGMRLDTYSENFHDIIALLRDMATAAELRALAARVDALESRRQ